ncbi:MAG: hypothetical protein RIB98_12170 [Acidimicrobiales bacterium]
MTDHTDTLDHAPTLDRTDPVSHTGGDAVARLRLVLRANATFSFVCGAVALVTGSWLSRELDIDHVTVTRLLGGGLILFAVAVLVISRLDAPLLRTESLVVSIADITWVLGSVAILLTGLLNETGNIVLALVGLVVADFGAMQLFYRAKATAGSRELRTATV